MKNTLLENFREGRVSIGTLSHLRSTTAVESLGYAGLDFILFDQEHCPSDSGEIAGYLTAATAAGLSSLVRVNAIERSALLKVLDAGAAGVIVPGLETPEQARELVRYAKFKPLGDRGYCMTRDGGWSFADSYRDGITGYMAQANADTMLIPQCETLGCLESIETITAMEGVDGIMVGPYDLSIAMGIPGQFTAPEFRAAVERILRACKANHKFSMAFAGNAQKAMEYRDMGFDSILLGLDILMLVEGYRNLLGALE